MPTIVKVKKISLLKVEAITNLPSKKSLAELLSEAWGRQVKGKVFQDDLEIREQGFDSGDSLVLNTGNASTDGFLGEIVGFEPGGFLVVANREIARDRKRLHLRQIPTDENEEPFKGISYFFVYKNYLLFLDNGLRWQTVSKYLSWMLGVCFDITKGVFVNLTTQIEIDGGNMAQLVEATKLEIVPQPISPITPMEEYINNGGDRREVISDDNTADRVLRAIRFDYEALEQYKKKTEGHGQIEVAVSVKLKNKRKLVPVGRMLPIAKLIESSPDSEFRLSGRGGRVVGKLIAANFMANVRFENSVIDNSTVSLAFQEALRSFVERGCIVR